MTSDTRITKLGLIRWAEFGDADRALNTRRRYRDILDNYVSPGVGGLQIREATPPGPPQEPQFP
ncbi:hypothetical protein [Arthrobacter sp. FW306-04-A]|uniref:hypothetical protein n=1 Tax=Arthrobacter sp. FW306-04-A TaxID=2879619 RepID=UPI0037C04A0C|nr:hypothetical protein LFT43_06440 [Arthrobacter sp. FW306-04-A]